MSFLSILPGVTVKDQSAATDASVDRIYPPLRGKFTELVNYITSLGYGVQLNDGFRTREVQAARYSASLAKRSRYPAAKPGTSTHEGVDVKFNGSQALDLSIINPDGVSMTPTNSQVYTGVGAWWQLQGPTLVPDISPIPAADKLLIPRWGGAWTGNFFDPVHFDFSIRAANPLPPPGVEADPIAVTPGTPSNEPEIAERGAIPRIKSGYCL